MIPLRSRLKLPRLHRVDPRRARGYRGYRGRRQPRPFWFWLALGGVLLGLMALEWQLSAAFPAVSRVCCGAATLASRLLGTICGLLPVPVSEWLAAGLAVGWLVWFLRRLLRSDWAGLGRGLCRLVCMVCAAAFLFVALFGVHHTAPALEEQLGLAVGQYSTDQLAALMERSVEQVNRLATQVPRDQEGACDFGSFRELARLVADAYAELAEEYPVYDRPAAGRVKRSLIGGRVMSYVSLAGYYCPWTGESVVSADVVDSHIPFNIAHEAAHGLGIGQEAACNFSAWLVCREQADPRLAYSGWLCAFVYVNNALYAADRESWERCYAGLCSQARLDLQLHSESLARFRDSAAQKLGSQANDALIRATGQPEGLRSYGRMVDLMLAYYAAGME